MTRRLPARLLAPLALLACEDGGPTGFVRFDVTGPWTETATVVENTCGAEIPAVSTTELFFLQSGDVLRVEVPGVVTAEGTIDPRTGEFEFGFVAEFENGTATYAQAGRFRMSGSPRADLYTSTSTLTFALDEGSCVVRSRERGVRG